jgi:U6 snRNA-associated Sm-like protein LSm1
MNPYGLEDVPPPGWALVEQLDKKLLIQLRDGRKIIGTLRSFDQFANLVVEGAVERVIVNNLFTDIRVGLHLIRGENVVLMGEVDPERDASSGLTEVSEAEIRRAQKAEKEEARLKGTMRARMDFLDLE